MKAHAFSKRNVIVAIHSDVSLASLLYSINLKVHLYSNAV
jgi:hypothetical protein